MSQGQYAELAVGELNSMEPYQFEYFIADLWRRQGYDAEVSQQSADGGIDVIARNGREVVGIQAKRYAQGNPVGVKTVREIAGVGNRPEFDRVAIATSGDFTSSAYKEANEHDVKLYTGDQLLKMNRSANGGARTPGGALAVGSLVGALASLGSALSSDPEEFGDMIINLIQLIVMLGIAYAILDAVLTTIFHFPLPWGI